MSVSTPGRRETLSLTRWVKDGSLFVLIRVACVLAKYTDRTAWQRVWPNGMTASLTERCDSESHRTVWQRVWPNDVTVSLTERYGSESDRTAWQRVWPIGVTASQGIFLAIAQLPRPNAFGRRVQLSRKLQCVCPDSKTHYQCIGLMAEQCATKVTSSKNTSCLLCTIVYQSSLTLVLLIMGHFGFFYLLDRV